ncbi:MAG: MCE family protein [Bdellovibrio sp.]|nr:MCE family protein [Bdellovibrio sp.]
MSQTKVGAFLAVGLFVILGSIFMLGSNKSYFQEVFRLRAYFDSVQGLNKGGVVSLSGVKVGNVDSIGYDAGKNLVEVVINIDAQFKNRIRKDSRIELRTQGALGDKFLFITPGIITTEFLANNEEITADYGNDILAVLSKRGNESEKLFDALNDFQKIMHSVSEQNKLPSVIAKLDVASGNLAEVTQKLNATVKTGSIDRSVEKFEKIMNKIDRGDGTLGALINDRSIHERIKSILGAGQKSQQVKQILKSSVED